MERTPVLFKNVDNGPTKIIGPDVVTILVEGKPFNPFADMPTFVDLRTYVNDQIGEALAHQKPEDVEQKKLALKAYMTKMMDAWLEHN